MRMSIKKCDNKCNNYLLSTDPFKLKSATLKATECRGKNVV